MKKFWLLGLLLFCVVGASSQEVIDSLQTFYRAGSSRIDTLFMRNGESMSSFFQVKEKPAPQPVPQEEPVVEVVEDTIVAEERPIPEVLLEKKPFYWALKTNALYDVMLIPNIGIEFAVNKQWSVAANGMYAWWSNSGKSKFWRIYGGDVEVRRWLGKKAEEKPLQGHHIGVYGQLLTYDFALDNHGYMADKWNYALGVSYGYSLPVAKRLNLDFTIGLGYWGGKYHEYRTIDDCKVWQASKNRHWWGPTKAEVSLVWLLGSSNSNKKGGAR